MSLAVPLGIALLGTSVALFSMVKKRNVYKQPADPYVFYRAEGDDGIPGGRYKEVLKNDPFRQEQPIISSRNVDNRFS